MSDHYGLAPERAMEKVIPEIEKFLLDKKLINGKDRTLRYRKEKDRFILKIWNQQWLSETKIAEWCLTQMVGCCGVVISTEASVVLEFRKKGLGTFLNSIRIKMAKLMHYGTIMCTVQSTNEHEIKILIKNGWKEVNEMKSPKTKNVIKTFVFNL